jgi:hypothetical protein
MSQGDVGRQAAESMADKVTGGPPRHGERDTVLEFTGGTMFRDKSGGEIPRMAKDLSSTKQRKKLSKKSFALPGKRKYPIPDKAHARNALARVAQNGTPAEQKKVRAAVRKRFPSIGKKRNKK